MDDLQQLCRDVAVEVMHWENGVEAVDFGISYQRGLELTPADAMRVVGKMVEKGFHYMLEDERPYSGPPCGSHKATFFNTRLLWEITRPNMPEAVFRAALAAVRGESR